MVTLASVTGHCPVTDRVEVTSLLRQVSGAVWAGRVSNLVKTSGTETVVELLLECRQSGVVEFDVSTPAAEQTATLECQAALRAAFLFLEHAARASASR